MTRLGLALAAAAALASAAPGAAREQPLPVTVVPGLELAELQQLAEVGAVGLVVPDAGPRTSEARARAALVRGKVRNSLRSGMSAGPPRIALRPPPPTLAHAHGIVLALPEGGEQRNDRRYPIAVVAPGWRGLLTSDSTRIDGLVSIADVASGKLRATAAANPVGKLRALDRRIRENGDARGLAAAVLAGVLAALALAWPRTAVAGFAAALGANLLLGILGVSEPWLVVTLLAAATIVGGAALALAARGAFELGLVLAAVLAAYLVAMAASAEWVALSPLGPTQNARFYGLSNLLETMLLVPALAGAVLLSRRLGLAAFAAVAVLALVAVAGSRFGADGGGAIVLVAGFAVAAVCLAGGGRTAAAAGAACAAVGLALVLVDALVGPATHVGRTVRGGPGEIVSALSDRVSLSWARATDEWAVAVVVGLALAALVVLVVRTQRLPLSREARALLLGLAAAVAVSLVVNDSPKEVAVGGLVAYLVLGRFTGAVGRDPVARIEANPFRSLST
jgi:hypothetical protein